MNSPNGDLVGVDDEHGLGFLTAADGEELPVLDEFDAVLDELSFDLPDDESRNPG